MPSAAKSRWKLSFGRSSTTSSSSSSTTPMSFICPISSSLMSDPVILSSGHTFDRPCVEACIHLRFNPPSLSSSPLIDFTSSSSILLIPNAALKSAIIDWCDRLNLPHPAPLSPDSALALVQRLMHVPTSSDHSASSCSYPSSSCSSSEINNNNNNNNNNNAASSSSHSSSSSSSSLLDDDTKTPKATTTGDADSSEEEEIWMKLRSPQISVKESGLITLRQLTRDSAEKRISLCTERILAALVLMLLSKNPSIQINAAAAIVNLSIEPFNKVKIVRSGAVPPLIATLKSCSNSYEARDNAAGALFSLALEDENKLVIGVLGAIPPLVKLFCQHLSVEAGMALHHLSLASNNVSKIVKTPGAVKSLLNVAAAADAGGVLGCRDEEMIRKMRRVVMMVLANLARRNEGRTAIMDADAVKAMVALMPKEEEYCLAVMYEMSKGSVMRFRALARAAGAERVLLAMMNEGRERGELSKEMAARTLRVIRDEGKGAEMAMRALFGDEDDDDEVGSVVSDGLVPFGRRHGDDFGGTSGSNSAKF